MNREKKNNRTGLIVSISIHTMLLLIVLFGFSCWEAPGPPFPTPCVEMINVGEDFFGSGKSEVITETLTEVIDELEEVIEEQNSEITELTEEIIEEFEETPTEMVNESLETVESGEPIQASEVNSVPKVTAQSKPDPTPDEGMQYVAPSGSPGKGKDTEAGVKGDPNGEDSDSDSGGGQDGLIKIGGWEKLKEPNFKNDINHGATLEFEFYVNELGGIEQIMWITSTLTPSEEELIEKRLRSELKLVKKPGEAQKTKGTYKIVYE